MLTDRNGPSAPWAAAKRQRAIRGGNFLVVADPVGANGLIVERTRFDRLNARNSVWTDCTFRNCSFESSYFNSARFKSCRLIDCHFLRCGLVGAQFDAECTFSGCSMLDSGLACASLVVKQADAIRFDEKSKFADTKITGHPFFDDRFFPRYVCDEVRGGQQATVYLGHRTSDGRRVAIKVFDKTFGGSTARGRYCDREIKHLRETNSPYVPRLLESDLGARSPYLVLERCGGKPLSDWIDAREQFVGPLRSALFRQAFLALASLKVPAGGYLLLRDIAPKNVMVDIQSERLTWWFIDLGLSKIVDGTSATTSMVAGTLRYMAPEVLAEKRNSVRSEMFSLAVTLALAVTGQHPFGECVLVEERLATIRDTEPDLTGIEPQYAEPLRRCLKYHPEDRFQTVDEVIAALPH